MLTCRAAHDGSSVWRKPDFYGPEHGWAFQLASVVAAYPFRPPYPKLRSIGLAAYSPGRSVTTIFTSS